MSKIILHVDLNAFFVRCEEIKNPNLENKAILIGHQGRGGIVSTCSYEARKYGVSSGMPMFKATQLCPCAIIIPGDYNYYELMSNKFISFMKQYSSSIEQASIDECYLDMSDTLSKIKDVDKYLKDLQNKLFLETKLKCSIGVAPTKFLAKMASDYKKPMGITIIRKKDIHKMLDDLPIESFFGIGKKTAPRLRELKINTIGDLSKRIDDEDPIIKNELGKFYLVIKDWLNGKGDDEVRQEPFNPKSIGKSHTLMEDTNNYDELVRNIKMLSKDISLKAKEADKLAQTVQLVLKDNHFRTINRSSSLKEASNDYNTIVDATIRLLDNNYDESTYIRLVGVSLQNLIDKSEVIKQLSIFDDFDEIKDECATKLLIAELNRKMNKSVFKTAREVMLEGKKKCN